jgi:hypothetical protein
MVRINSEMAAVTIGSRGRREREIVCKFGHNAGKVVTNEATNTGLGGSFPQNSMLMAVVLGERNKWMNGMNSPVVAHNLRDFRFGNKGLFTARDCKTAKTSGDEEFGLPGSPNLRIFRAYFRKRAHSSVVGNRLKDY